MDSLGPLPLMLALLAAVACTAQEKYALKINKCCDVHEMLSADGELCVEAPWPRKNKIVLIRPGLDEEWMRYWLPPGLPLHNITNVYSSQLITFQNFSNINSVNASSLWSASLLQNEDRFRNTIIFLGEDYVARPKNGGGFRKALYCVDAAAPPLGPYAMRFRTECTEEECAKKCCHNGKLLKNKRGHWECKGDAEGFWAPSNSSLALDIEYPSRRSGNLGDNRLSSWEVRNAHLALRDEGIIHFHFSSWETCFDFYRSSDDSLHEGLFYQEHSRITRGVYWLLRPLCILSTLLLLASLVSIACDKSMRRNTHGRCLASYAACLFAFNIGQVVFYIAFSDRVSTKFIRNVPEDLQNECKYFALCMYFLLTAAWFWLTAIFENMKHGFCSQVSSPREERRRFLIYSAFACGLPVLMTIMCSFLHASDSEEVRWYNPSLVESRVCYNAYVTYKEGNVTDSKGSFLISGTALVYFVPVLCLVVWNIICLAQILRKVHTLKRRDSLFLQKQVEISLGQIHPEGNNPPSSHTATGHGNRNRISIDTKTIKLYIKMIIMTGVIELLTEFIMWTTTVFENEGLYSEDDLLGIAYRAAGYVTDLFRAAVVTWLAAPDGGYLGLVKRLRPGKGEQAAQTCSRRASARAPPGEHERTRSLPLCVTAVESTPRQPLQDQDAVLPN